MIRIEFKTELLDFIVKNMFTLLNFIFNSLNNFIDMTDIGTGLVTDSFL